MTYDIDITIIKQFAILMDMNDAILVSWIFSWYAIQLYMLKYYSVMLYWDKRPTMLRYLKYIDII